VNSKQLPYFQDLADTSRIHAVDLYPYEPLRLQADDQIQVNISSLSPQASQFFNQMLTTPTAGVGMGGGAGQAFQNNYAVNQQGAIILPILGEVTAAGLTTEELRVRIKDLLKDYLKEAVVTVRITNFRVTVIGDVGHPTVVPVQGERINLLEALGAAGDLTVYAKRYNVKVMRRTSGNLEVANLNINSSKAIQSPFFQLKQNDVVYVEPNKSKGFASESWLALVPLLTPLVWILPQLISFIAR
jgi:polysaccharide export outer membrane protein